MVVEDEDSAASCTRYPRGLGLVIVLCGRPVLPKSKEVDDTNTHSSITEE